MPLLDATSAARILGVSERTARDRARRAHASGDDGVSRVGDRWIADEAWWRSLFAEMPKTRGNARIALGTPQNAR